jgi:hypothetical protein
LNTSKRALVVVNIFAWWKQQRIGPSTCGRSLQCSSQHCTHCNSMLQFHNTRDFHQRMCTSNELCYYAQRLEKQELCRPKAPCLFVHVFVFWFAYVSEGFKCYVRIRSRKPDAQHLQPPTNSGLSHMQPHQK